MVFGYLFLFQTDTNPPTPNLCLNIPFHFYIHDHVLDEPTGTLPIGVNTYVPDIGKQLRFKVFGYLFLAKTDTNPPTNSYSMSQHSFPLLHS